MKKFDKEYSTQYTPEKEYLKKQGIYPGFGVLLHLINNLVKFGVIEEISK